MSAETVREALDAHLAPLLPPKWKWVPTQRNIDAITQTTVVWKQMRITRLAEAPIGTVRVEGVLTVITPYADADRADEALDDDVTMLCAAIDALEDLAWTEAQKVAVGNYFGYDIQVWTTATPTITEPEE